MTDKQEIFRDYLLKRLGFHENSFTYEYVEHLEKIAYIHKGIAAIEEKDLNENKDMDYYEYDHESEQYLPEHFSIIDFLVWEYKLKKRNIFKIIKNKSNYISATDLANYTYCPVGYSIGKTFLTPKSLLGNIGTKKHEEHRLIQFIKKRQIKTDFDIEKKISDEKYKKIGQLITNDNKSFFKDIDNSELIFSGHSDVDNDIKYFINKERAFTGQPDYIFRNKEDKNFIVEEKFKNLKEANQIYFFRNHKVQLASYIYFINKFKIDYGYLVYWLYDYKHDFEIKQCKILKINRTQKTKDFLFNAYSLVLKFNEKRFLNINLDKLNPKKCANCVYVLLCCHKNKRINQVSLPYQRSYFNLYFAEFPEELKKDKNRE
ncbi:MAG: hypothetical protein P9L97_04200 [Candidatus Tenebribacter davisii]|nr:hypothetical protein [Candidatus Tenebribacter davisii]